MKKFRTMEKHLADFPQNGKDLSAMRKRAVARTHNDQVEFQEGSEAE